MVSTVSIRDPLSLRPHIIFHVRCSKVLWFFPCSLPLARVSHKGGYGSRQGEHRDFLPLQCLAFRRTRHRVPPPRPSWPRTSPKCHITADGSNRQHRPVKHSRSHIKLETEQFLYFQVRSCDFSACLYLVNAEFGTEFMTRDLRSSLWCDRP